MKVFQLSTPVSYTHLRTDMRKSIDGLCAIVEDQLHMEPRRSTLYLFCGKRCDRIKALLWESDGFVLLYKRMEVQGRFQMCIRDSITTPPPVLCSVASCKLFYSTV